MGNIPVRGENEKVEGRPYPLAFREFVINQDYTPLLKAVTKGNQEKYINQKEELYIKCCFDYQEIRWNDDLVELVATELCHYLGIKTIEQGRCTVIKEYATLSGSYSKNCLAEGEYFLTYEQMEQEIISQFSLEELRGLKKKFGNTIKDRLEFQVFIYGHYIEEHIARQYLEDMHLIDSFLLNEDRHTSNFGIVYSEKENGYRTSELFDFGLSLFEHDRMYSNMSYEIALRKVKLKNIATKPSKLLHFLRTEGTDRTKENIKKVQQFKKLKAEIPNQLAEKHINNQWGLQDEIL